MEIKRDQYLKKLIDSKHNGMIKVVTGVRRSGKSYLLFNLFCQYLKQEGIAEDHIIKVDLEDRRNKALRDPDALLNHIDSRMTDQQMYYILLDEVQHVDDFEDVLNSYLKIENADVYVTGSNSKFLSKDVITEFRGRGDVHLPSEEKREQEVRSLKDINDSFKKFVITEDLISRYQDDDGITYMNIYEFLLNEDNL